MKKLEPLITPMSLDSCFYTRLGVTLKSTSVDEKITLVDRLHEDYQRGVLSRAQQSECFMAEGVGFPSAPVLIDPKGLPRRGFHAEVGRIAFLHAVAHIEFNAINLALDAAYRFRDFPEQYYADWLQVAAEEVKHFRLLNDRLVSLGSHYGDLPAHRGLWDMCEKTQYDALERMALVPRYLEAKGLDVTPAMIVKLNNAGDHESAAILKIILTDEVGHVRMGSDWFRYLCDQQGVDPVERYFAFLDSKVEARFRGPFNEVLRKEAGFSDLEITMLNALIV